MIKKCECKEFCKDCGFIEVYNNVITNEEIVLFKINADYTKYYNTVGGRHLVYSISNNFDTILTLPIVQDFFKEIDYDPKTAVIVRLSLIMRQTENGWIPLRLYFKGYKDKSLVKIKFPYIHIRTKIFKYKVVKEEYL